MQQTHSGPCKHQRHKCGAVMEICRWVCLQQEQQCGRERPGISGSLLPTTASPHSALPHFVLQARCRVAQLPPRLLCSCSALQSLVGQSTVSRCCLTPLLRLCCSSDNSAESGCSRAEQGRVSSAALNRAPKGPKVAIQTLLEGNAK